MREHKEPTKLSEMYRNAAAMCRAAGVPNEEHNGGTVHQWVMTHCSYRPGTEFFIVFGICCAYADMDAQSEGYDNSVDRALSRVESKFRPRKVKV